MEAMQVMSALSQSTRWETFRLLVEALPDGMAAGDIAEAVNSSANTMSAHLAILSRARLISGEKIGRTVVYKADTAMVKKLSEFLAKACGAG